MAPCWAFPCPYCCCDNTLALCYLTLCSVQVDGLQLSMLLLSVSRGINNGVHNHDWRVRHLSKNLLYAAQVDGLQQRQQGREQRHA